MIAPIFQGEVKSYGCSWVSDTSPGSPSGQTMIKVLAGACAKVVSDESKKLTPIVNRQRVKRFSRFWKSCDPARPAFTPLSMARRITDCLVNLEREQRGMQERYERHRLQKLAKQTYKPVSRR